MGREDYLTWKQCPEGRRFWTAWRVQWVADIPLVQGGWWDRQHLMEKPEPEAKA